MDKARFCRLCKGEKISHLLDIENVSISHYLRKSKNDPDPRFDVGFEYCCNCGLLQIVEPIPADLIYNEADTYTTSFQQPKHLDDLITTTIARQDPGKAIDVGCNDGALMEALRRAGYTQIAGVEPNAVAAAIAGKKGYKVYNHYLTKELADRILRDYGRFDTVYLRHVVEHVTDLEEFFASVRALLRDGGLLVVELPDVEEGFALGSPVILWEEHVSYFTQELAEYMLERFGFRVHDRRRYVFGGGTLAFIARKQARENVTAISPPNSSGTIKLLHHFAAGISKHKSALQKLISVAKSKGYRVLVYGAAPRSCLLVAVCEIADAIDFVVDDREDIQNRLMPGTNQFIRPLQDVAADAAGSKLLCLLGVGSENEFKVRAKLDGAIGANFACISLFPPRDTLESVDRTRRAIEEGQE